MFLPKVSSKSLSICIFHLNSAEDHCVLSNPFQLLLCFFLYAASNCARKEINQVSVLVLIEFQLLHAPRKATCYYSFPVCYRINLMLLVTALLLSAASTKV